MAILVNILLVALIALVLALAFIRIREQGKLKDTVKNLDESDRRFGASLDTLEGFVNSLDDEPSQPAEVEPEARANVVAVAPAAKAYTYAQAVLPDYEAMTSWPPYQVGGVRLSAHHRTPQTYICYICQGKLDTHELRDNAWLREDSMAEYGVGAVH